MFRGNRSIVVALVGCLIAAPALWFLISDFASVSRSYERHASDASDYYAYHAESVIKESCLRISPQLKSDCVSQAEESARENQRREQDLAAQKITAWWTQIMGGAALIGMALSAIGVALVWTTFRETRRTADAAVDNYKAFITFESAMIDVSFERIDVHISNDSPQAIAYFCLANVGRSPAIIEGIYVQGAKPGIYNKIIASGRKEKFEGPFIFAVPDGRVVYGFVTYITAMGIQKKRLFAIIFDRSQAGTWKSSIHPDDVLDEGHPEYGKPFPDIVE